MDKTLEVLLKQYRDKRNQIADAVSSGAVNSVNSERYFLWEEEAQWILHPVRKCTALKW